ncbi:MAG: hypothetical protein Q9159_000193 [Coniocarpon cinnabarinum]
MTTIGRSLATLLPKPKHGEDSETPPVHTKSRGPQVVTAESVDSSQVVLKRSGAPPYGSRSGWRPRAPEDFGDGGAFPEVPVAQYPLNMGRKTAGSSNALALQLNEEGKVKYDAIARRGHSESRVIHSQFKDLIPLRQQANSGEISLARPSQDEAEETRQRTQNALEKLVNGAVAAQKPKNVKGTSRAEPTFVSYTPNAQMGDKNSGNKTRIIKIVEKQQDPMEPPKHKHKKIPRGPPSPPAPIMHSPPRKLTAEDQEMWRIPPPVSNWKNPKGYTVPLDKRLAADGRGLQDVSINDKFAQLSESLQTADRHAREEVQQRALMQQKLAEKKKLRQEENLRALARRAREDRAAAGSRRRPSRSDRSPSYSRSPSRSPRRSRSVSSYDSRSDSEEDARREREKMRRERRQENERQMRMSRMGQERRMQQMAREQNRDISEKVALGLAKPTQSGESMYDSRLFNQTSGFGSGFNEDQPYDKPLFADREAVNHIYRPTVNEDEGEDAGETMDKIKKSDRFDVLGKAGKGFKGAAEAEARDGPVQFEKDAADPFGVDQMIKESMAAAKPKRYGMQDAEDSRPSKKARVDEQE